MTETTKNLTPEESATEARRAYKRAWYARNKERVAEYNKSYWERRGQELVAEMRAKEEAEKAEKRAKRAKRG